MNYKNYLNNRLYPRLDAALKNKWSYIMLVLYTLSMLISIPTHCILIAIPGFIYDVGYITALGMWIIILILQDFIWKD